MTSAIKQHVSDKPSNDHVISSIAMTPHQCDVFKRLVLVENSTEMKKTGVPGEKPLQQGQQPTTNTTHIWHQRRESDPGHIGGR